MGGMAKKEKETGEGKEKEGFKRLACRVKWSNSCKTWPSRVLGRFEQLRTNWLLDRGSAGEMLFRLRISVLFV